ncbi:MAG: DEAD/DEAH box helicase [Solirubrobacterales bacterium]|nr:DEAD/DEAH box helicase [Solirubrobacterales bacterium]MBV9366942.1 DEAD/DEAH box helicase [Solirubrobacterales bacterium]MBV9684283.1 DEAD/DEAH box helicase [Solirubrobacterales bacterium]
MSTESFADLGVSRAVISSLAEAGITEPFAIQRAVIGDAIAGRDVIAKSPTGSGKTLAFAIPLVERMAAEDPRPGALVLAPTRELATQIVDDVREIAHTRALRITAVYGGVGLVKQAKHAAASHVLVATPGRLEDLLARGAFRLDRIRMLVLDEADRMLDMGFRPAIDRIVAACPRARQTLFFSATLDGEAGRIAKRYAHDPAIHQHGPATRRANAEIEHRFVQVAHEHRVEALVRELGRDRDLTLVFVRTKHGADRLVKRLAAHGVKAVAMHGDKSQRQREQALARFEAGAVDTLVATDVAARGIDVDGISHVINFDPPADGETYVHRVGRTGRAGRTGVGITLLSPEQHHDVTKLADHLGLDHDLRGTSARRPTGHPSPHPGAANGRASRRRRPSRRRARTRG